MIIINDEDILRTECADVTIDEVDDLIKLLENELNIANVLGKGGIGLAAPQIGIFKKAAIIRLKDYKINLINAKIEKSFDKSKFSEEGCLSFPGKTIDTVRYQEIYIIDNLDSEYL